MSDALPAGKPVLVMDAACPHVFVGLWQSGAWQATAAATEPALDALFGLVEHCLDETDCHLREVSAFVYDEGPGSVLGIRVAAMALRTWQAMPELNTKPVFAYRSLELLAAQITLVRSGPFQIIADYRKDAWLSLLSQGGEIRTVADAELDSDQPLYYLRQRKAWRQPPARAVEVTLNLLETPQLLCDEKLLRKTESPGVFAVQPVEYKRWQPVT